jgi:hypothetical protein
MKANHDFRWGFGGLVGVVASTTWVRHPNAKKDPKKGPDFLLKKSLTFQEFRVNWGSGVLVVRARGTRIHPKGDPFGAQNGHRV